MGLDMYLIGEYHLRRQTRLRETIKKQLGLEYEPETVTFEVGYWRKHYHIHDFFIDELGIVIHDLADYPVDPEILEKLRDLCLDPKEETFYGDEYTVDVCNRALKLTCSLIYEASW